MSEHRRACKSPLTYGYDEAERRSPYAEAALTRLPVPSPLPPRAPSQAGGSQTAVVATDVKRANLSRSSVRNKENESEVTHLDAFAFT